MISDRSLRRRVMCAAAALSAVATVSCGETDSQDYFYLYVFNGYPGAEEITLYSTAGPLAEGLPFGQRTEEPVLVDRNRFDGLVQMTAPGVPGIASISVDSFDFYPQETITLFVGRRQGPAQFEVRTLRHTLFTKGSQGTALTSTPCVINFQNALSVSNNGVGDERYDYQMEFRLRGPSAQAIYSASPGNGSGGALDQDVVTACGQRRLGDLLTGAATTQVQSLQAIQAEEQQDSGNWFFLVRDTTSRLQNAQTYRFGNWLDPASDSISGVRSSRELAECVADILVPENQMQPVEEACNGGFNVDNEAFISQCAARLPYTGVTVRADDPQGQLLYSNLLYNGMTGVCEAEVRLRTRVVDSIFLPPKRDGAPPSFSIQYPAYTWQYMVVYGRPIDPLVEQFNTFQYSVNFEDVEYPGGATNQPVAQPAAPADPAAGQ